MSFQRRNEAIGGAGAARNSSSIRQLQGRVSNMSLRDQQQPLSSGGRQPIIGRKPISSIPRQQQQQPLEQQAQKAPTYQQERPKQQSLNILGCKPSISKSSDIQVTSIGSPTMDGMVFKQHGGIPLGTTTLIKDISRKDIKDEQNLKYLTSINYQNTIGLQFLATGVYHQRRSMKKDITADDHDTEKLGHIGIVIGEWIDLQDIPGVYISKSKKSSSNNDKKKEADSIVSKLSNVEQKRQDLKIAWRYGMKNNDSLKNNGGNGGEIKEDLDFVPRLDIQSNVFPRVTKEEVLQINVLGNTLENILLTIQQTIMKNPKKLIRLYLPNFLNPKYYPRTYFQQANVIKFLNGLKHLQSLNESKFLTLITTTIDMNLPILENFSNTVIELKPFDQQTIDYLTKNYKSQGLPNKVQQGMLNITKMGKVSEYGHMNIRLNEIVYHISKNGFVVELWSIPVDAGDDNDENKKKSTNENNSNNKKQDNSSIKASKSIEPHGHDHGSHSHNNPALEY
ncbi:hypothetical protein ACO0SA_004338 [Hanseniaspora valbyensis]